MSSDVNECKPLLGGVCAGLGLAPNKFETVIGVAKAGAYTRPLFSTT